MIVMLRLLFVCSLLLALSVGLAYPWVEDSVFPFPVTGLSESSLSIQSRALTVEGADASYAFSSLGFVLQGLESTPTSKRFVLNNVPPETVVRIVNRSNQGDSSGKPLSIRLVRPARRFIAEVLAEGVPRSEPVSVRFAYLAPQGILLGEEIIDLSAEPIVRRETDHPSGFAEIVVDLLENPAPEVLDTFVADFDPLPRIVTSIPQLAAAELSEESSLATQINFVEGRGARLRFFSPAGDPLELLLDGTPATEFSLPEGLSRGSLLLQPPPGSLGYLGHAVVEWDRPGTISVEFIQFDPQASTISSRVITAAEWPQLWHSVVVEHSPDTGISTGIAVSNPGDKAIDLRFGISNIESPAATETNSPIVEVTLGPRQQLTFLIEQFCERFVTDDTGTICEEEFSGLTFSGEFTLAANNDVGLLALLTRNGLPASLIPSNRLSKSPF